MLVDCYAREDVFAQVPELAEEIDPVLKHLDQWSYKELEGRVKDSLVLRWFCRVAFHAVPDASTLWRWEQTLRPETVHALVDRMAQLAKQARVTKGRKLRLDATCVQTN